MSDGHERLQPRLVDREHPIRDQLARYEQPDFIHVGSANLLECVDQFMGRFTLQAREVESGRKSPILVFVEGNPGNGKSTAARLIQAEVRNRQQRLRPFGIKSNFLLLNWDAAEDDLRDETYVDQLRKRATSGRMLAPQYRELIDRIDTLEMPTSGLPYSPEFLDTVRMDLQLRLIEELRENKDNTVIVIDQPGGTALKEKGQWQVARPYAAGMKDALPDKSLSRRSFILVNVGIVGGPVQMEIFNLYREAINLAESLEQANEANYSFRRPLFRDEHEWRRQQGGGSLQQIKEAQSSSFTLLETLLSTKSTDIPDYVYGAFNRTSQPHKILRAMPRNVRETTEEALEILEDPEVVYRTAQNLGVALILQNDFDLGGPIQRGQTELVGANAPHHAVIGLNNPHLPISRDTSHIAEFKRFVRDVKRQSEEKRAA